MTQASDPEQFRGELSLQIGGVEFGGRVDEGPDAIVRLDVRHEAFDLADEVRNHGPFAAGAVMLDVDDRRQGGRIHVERRR